MPGTALVSKSSALRKHFEEGSAVHNATLEYLDYLMIQISYLGICNNSHSIEQRFSRWLLMMQDRARSMDLRFTQDAIAGVLGTRRATISVATAALEDAGLLSYTPARLQFFPGKLSSGRPAAFTGPSVRFAVKMLSFSGRAYLQPGVLQFGKVMAALR